MPINQAAEEFEHIVDLYSQKIYFAVRPIVIDHDDATDVVQNTFIKVWQNLANFRAQSNIYTWIYRIAINEALSHLRSSRAHIFASPTERDHFFETLFDNDPYFDGDEAEKSLQRAIAQLPPKQRAVFLMRYYDQMPYAEMSVVLGTSEGALKASYHHAVKKIEEQLNLTLQVNV